MVKKMSLFKKCNFYREDGTSKGSGIKGYCDLDQSWVVCGGDIQACKKLSLLKKYLYEEKRKEGGVKW